MALSVKIVKNSHSNSGGLWQSQVTSQVVEAQSQKDLFIPFQALSESSETDEIPTAESVEPFQDELSALSAEQQPDTNWQPLIPVSVEELTEAQSRIAEGLDQVLIPNSNPTPETTPTQTPTPEPAPTETVAEKPAAEAIQQADSVAPATAVPSPAETTPVNLEEPLQRSDNDSSDPEQSESVESPDETTQLANEAVLSAYKAELEAEFERQHAENELALQHQKQQLEQTCAELSSLLTNLQGTIQNYYEEQQEPLLKLSTHIARQLVRAELTLSTTAIESLITASLEFFSSTEGLKVFLNPIDKELLEKHNPLPEEYLILADEELFPGSVRISNAERHTEDLIVDRLSEITEQIFESVEAHLLEPITHLENTKES
ncbi:MAG: FliH/SctL family protein [Methylococcaceae bacterium]|nr:FliH/SctL family protein [Methylococcaceae bacterium]